MPRTLALFAIALPLASGCGSGLSAEQPSVVAEEPPVPAPAPASEPPQPAPTESPQAAPAEQPPLRWELSAKPTTLTMAERDRFRLQIAVTNEGSETVDPQRHQGDFRLDGESHVGLNLWFGNGVITKDWSALAPGETATDERTPGEQLFAAPGKYVLSFAHGSVLTSVEVTVKR